MCALRDSRSIPAISLACQYRLNVTPKRPVQRKLIRRRKLDERRKEDNGEKEVKTEERKQSVRTDSEEEDFDFDADDDEDMVVVDDTDLSQRYYLMACKEMNIRPLRVIHQGLIKEAMSCKGTVLLSDDVKAATIAFVANHMCESIEFEGNEIGQHPSTFFGDMLTRNAYITELRIRWNAIGSKGAESICRPLLKNNNVKILDLTGNQFKEGDAEHFKELLEENFSIQELYLGHNFFRETGGEQIADGLVQNDVIRVLDLSWNHLRLNGAIAIGKALEKNTSLEVLDLAWNGLYIQGTSHISAALTKNQTLTDLDITCNRLSETCVAQFLNGLRKNTTLKTLRMARNHISHVGAVVILEYIKTHPQIGLEFIDLGDQHVHDDFLKLLAEIKETRELEVKYGAVWSLDRDPIGFQDQTEDELAILNENPHYVLMEFMRIQKLRLVDLFHQMDKDNSKGISVTEFQDGLKAMDIPLKRKTLQKFVRNIDSDKNGEIDFSELLEANRNYKAQVRKLALDNIPIETTDIGRIQKLLRKIMLNGRGQPNTPNEPLDSTDQGQGSTDQGRPSGSSQRGSIDGGQLNRTTQK